MIHYLDMSTTNYNIYAKEKTAGVGNLRFKKKLEIKLGANTIFNIHFRSYILTGTQSCEPTVCNKYYH